MVVKKPKFTAEIRFEFDVLEDWDCVRRYMERNGWVEGRGGTGFAWRNCYDSYLTYSKEFIDVNTMQKEVQDINDAFNR